ncbi:MAG: biopolymer transporter ExbD [Pseudobdellovibrionaceae bacterium]
MDGEINLVPFIDLLSMCICFLLMTAIWIEVGSIQLYQLFGTDGMDNNHPVEVEVRLQAPNEYRVQIEQAGKVINAMELKSDATMDAKGRVSQFMAQVQNLILSSGSEVQLSARVIPNPSVEYGEMISILDILKGYGVSALAVVPTR